MDNVARVNKLLLLSLLTSSLIGCGGGGSSQSPNTPDTAVPVSVELKGENAVNEGQQITISAQASAPNQVASYSWSVSGEVKTGLSTNQNIAVISAPEVNKNSQITLTLDATTSSGQVISQTHNIEIKNILKVFNVTATASSNGMISPQRAEVEEGSTSTFTITPNTSYEIDQVNGCNGTLDGLTYQTSTINESCDITVSFKAIPLSKQAGITDDRLATCIDSQGLTTPDQLSKLTCTLVKNIEGLDAFQNLTELLLENSEFDSEISLPALPKLTRLFIDLRDSHNTKTPFLDLSEVKDLKYASLQHLGLERINLNENTKLKELRLEYNSLTSVELTHLTALETLFIYENQLTNIDVSNNSNLKLLNVNNNNLVNIDISQNINIEQLNLSSNSLTTIDLSNNRKLKYLTAIGNQISALDLSTNTNIEWLRVSHNALNSVDLSANSKLTTVWLSDNLITDISGVESIQDKAVFFTIYNNRLTPDSISYLENLRDNLGYSKIRIVE